MNAAICWSAVACDLTAHADGVDRLPTPAWGRPGNLQLRGDSVAHGLLLRRDAGAVYRFDPVQRTLAAVDSSAWDRSSAPPTDCASQHSAPAILIDTATGKASLGGVPLPSAGPQVVKTVRSPGGGKALVVSAAAARASFAPALGAGHQPPFFHQVVRLDTGRGDGRAVRLPFGGRTGALMACWSADEQFAVYADLIMTSVAIVRLDAEGKPP